MVRESVANALIRTGCWLGEDDFFQRRWGFVRFFPNRDPKKSTQITGDPEQQSKSNDPAWRIRWHWQLLYCNSETPFRPMTYVGGSMWSGPLLPVKTKLFAVRVGPLSSQWICRLTNRDVLVPSKYTLDSSPVGLGEREDLSERQSGAEVEITFV
tara:strand:+ start:398 stop:862 length:465 start_codon:yes stop_codon:yes gene_type:complete